MATINFLIQSQKGDLVPIYIRFRNGRQYDLKAKTKIFIDPAEWSSKKQSPLKPQKSDELVSIVNQMNQLRSNLMDYFHNSIKNGLNIDGEWLRRFVDKGTSNPNDLPIDLTGYFEYYLIIKSSEVKKTTQKKITTFKGFIENFEKWAGKHYLLTEVNHDFRIKLEKYGAEMNYSSRYIFDVLNYVKVISRHAQRNGVSVNRQFEEFKIKRVKSDYITLNLQELDNIEKVELASEYLDNARDWLLISCETAQRVSDFQSFHKGLIKEIVHENGAILSILQFKQDKTEKDMAILLSKRVLRILKKRNGNFPRSISDVNYNKYIKKVCQIAGVTGTVVGSKMVVNLKTKEKRKIDGIYPKFELVTSHIGRRSFVTNNRNIMPDNLIMNNTGHSSERMLSEYDHKGKIQTAIDQYNYLNK